MTDFPEHQLDKEGLDNNRWEPQRCLLLQTTTSSKPNENTNLKSLEQTCLSSRAELVSSLSSQGFFGSPFRPADGMRTSCSPQHVENTSYC